MNRQWKQALVTGLMVLGWGVLVDKAQAVNPDSIVVNVTPNVTYSVHITSPMTGGYQFGSQALGATTLSTSAIGVTNDGNVSEYFTMSIANSSPGNWAPQTGAPGADQYEMQALLTTANAQPVSSGVSEALTTSAPGTGATHYGQGGFAKTPASTTRFLWLQLLMPTDLITSTGVAQTMLLTVNAQGS
jgi:hypothetical protein